MDCAPVLGAHSYAVFNQDLFQVNRKKAQKSNPKKPPGTQKNSTSGTVCLGSKAVGPMG